MDGRKMDIKPRDIDVSLLRKNLADVAKGEPDPAGDRGQVLQDPGEDIDQAVHGPWPLGGAGAHRDHPGGGDELFPQAQGGEHRGRGGATFF